MTKRQLQYIRRATALTAAMLLPTPLFAAQSGLPEVTIEPTPTMLNLPSYSYQQAGAVAAAASPVTISGHWPSPKPVQPLSAATSQSLIPVGGDAILILEGEASYYSRAGCLGCDQAMIMANGQSLNDHALTMAIGADKKHLVGRTAKVTSLATGQAATVLITDTGGFYRAKYGRRVADLTIATKNAIGMAGGVGQVRVEVF